MKKSINIFLSLFAILLMFISCRSSTDVVMDNPPIEETATNIYTGNFISQAHPTSGVAKITVNQNQLDFQNFKTDPGPQINVYLVSDLSKILTDYKDLGKVKGINGNYSYATPANIEFKKYKYVVIWCVDFNVNFGYAILAP